MPAVPPGSYAHASIDTTTLKCTAYPQSPNISGFKLLETPICCYLPSAGFTQSITDIVSTPRKISPSDFDIACVKYDNEELV